MAIKYAKIEQNEANCPQNIIEFTLYCPTKPRHKDCSRLNENGPFGLSGAALLGGIWPCWNRCVFSGRSVSLGIGFEVSDAQVKPSIPLFSR